MEFKVLGCSGGVGGMRATSAYAVGESILLDCGTGVGTLSLEQMARIDHIFISHIHLDHIVYLPLLIDSVAELRNTPLTVYASAETIASLQQHVFNWLVWPDFQKIPNEQSPSLIFHTLTEGETVVLDGVSITALPACHTVATFAYCADSGAGKLVYSADTTYCPEQIAAINALDDVRHFILEVAFPESQRSLASDSRHHCPSTFCMTVNALSGTPQIHLSHLKPGFENRIMADLDAQPLRVRPTKLQPGQILKF